MWDLFISFGLSWFIYIYFESTVLYTPVGLLSLHITSFSLIVFGAFGVLEARCNTDRCVQSLLWMTVKLDA